MSHGESQVMAQNHTLMFVVTQHLEKNIHSRLTSIKKLSTRYKHALQISE